jgi:hypothetical protein
MRPASGCTDAEVIMGKHWPQEDSGRSRVAAETVKMQMNAEWGLVKRGRGEVVQRCVVEPTVEGSGGRAR